MTMYDELTALVGKMTPAERDDCIAYWYECHVDEPQGTHEDLLSDDFMCDCCGVDFSGYDRDLLNEDGSVPANFEAKRGFWEAVAEKMKG